MNTYAATAKTTIRHCTRRHRIAFVQACWHREIVDNCKTAFHDCMHGLGYSEAELDFFEVPGVFEIPLTAKRLIERGEYGAVVAAGLVVDGGIYRHEFVSSAVIDGLMRVQLDTGVPVFSAVLTPHHFQPTPEHQAFFLDHFKVKGAEAARACHQTLQAFENAGLVKKAFAA